MWMGMTQVVLGQAVVVGEPLASVVAMGAVTALGTVNGVLLDYLAELARRFAELPWAEVGVSLDSPVEVAAAYAVIAAGALLARRLGRRAGPLATALAGRSRTSSRARVALALALAAAALAVAADATSPGAPDRLTVSFLDVGQGDATLVQHPAGGSLLIDGGPVEARVYRLVREAGVDRLGLLVATHAAADHHGGLRELLQHVPVDLLLEGGDGTRDPGFQAMLAEANRQRVRTVPAVAGQVLQVGELRVEVLWPEPREGPSPEDPNLRAVTTLVSAGEFELLASGDAESPSLASLELPDVDVLKVPHHGSEDEGLPELLTELRPEVAGIGVGEDNGYGHPTPSTIAALEESGADVYRTDLDGTIEATVTAGGLEVTAER
jgi:competence protein ComEC